MRRLAIGAAVFAVFFVTGCGLYRVNPPLSGADLVAKRGYRYRNLAETPENNTEKNFIIVTMSGGGTRAAALAYGVVEHMSRAKLDRSGTTLLDEIDVISSVSGGSFAAAYLGLFGKDKFLQSFRQDVLERKIERDVLYRVAAPWNWPDMLLYGRSDLAEKYYNDYIFNGRTYAEMPHRRPFVILNATDLTTGAGFSFSQDDFDRICSDLEGIPVARAVLASSAFPVAFTPITLKNYGQSECGLSRPLWVSGALQDFELNPTRFHRAEVWKSYEDAAARPYIHLSDGGIADNIGLRGPEVSLSSTDSPWHVLDKKQVERVAVIVVDAKSANLATIDQSSRRPLFTTVLEASATNPIDNYSFDTVESLRLFVEEQRKALEDYQSRKSDCDSLAAELCRGSISRSCQQDRQQQCYGALNATDEFRPRVPKYYEIHVQFEAIKDPAERVALEAIPTTLQLPNEDIRRLEQTGGKILDQSQVYQDLLADLKADCKSAGK
jgi:NTE family protein